MSYPAAWRMKRYLVQAMMEREANSKWGTLVQLGDPYSPCTNSNDAGTLHIPTGTLCRYGSKPDQQ